MTFILILGVPTAGATMAPDLLPTALRYLSDVLPFAQAVKITKNVAYFGGSDSLAPILILLAWAAVAGLCLSVDQYRANRQIAPEPVTVARVEAGSVPGAMPQVNVLRSP
jgi:hypothetical protein